MKLKNKQKIFTPIEVLFPKNRITLLVYLIEINITLRGFVIVALGLLGKVYPQLYGT
ncbi:hypothetical protein PBNK5_03740 [Pectobacterium brasiliense]